jgi:hypothetical protein
MTHVIAAKEQDMVVNSIPCTQCINDMCREIPKAMKRKARLGQLIIYVSTNSHREQ